MKREEQAQARKEKAERAKKKQEEEAQERQAMLADIDQAIRNAVTKHKKAVADANRWFKATTLGGDVEYVPSGDHFRGHNSDHLNRVYRKKWRVVNDARAEIDRLRNIKQPGLADRIRKQEEDAYHEKKYKAMMEDIEERHRELAQHFARNEAIAIVLERYPDMPLEDVLRMSRTMIAEEEDGTWVVIDHDTTEKKEE